MSNPYEYCIEQGRTSDANSLAHCLAESAQSHRMLQEEEAQFNVIFFLIFAATLVFFMQAGFAMICAGSVRKKNVQNTTLKNLLDVCGASVAFYAIGYAFAFGNHTDEGVTFIGSSNFFLMDMASDDSGLLYAQFFYQFAFAATSATIVAGTLAERCQMNAYLMYSMALTGFVYPVVAHSVWSKNGFLSSASSSPLLGSGMLDFAGSGVVHVTGGFTALIATKLLGPRKGRFYDERGELLEEPIVFAGHSKSLQMLGTFILWFGWFGFNAGSAIDSEGVYDPVVVTVSVVNSTLSGSMAGVVALFTNLIITERRTGEPHYNLNFAMNGCLGGLAAITGSCGLVEPWAALIIGFVAGLIFLATSNMLVRFKLDDAVDAIPVHFACGSWGVLATGLLANPNMLNRYLGVEAEHVGWFYSFSRGSADASLLGCQVIGLLFIIGWVLVIMFPFFVLLNYLGMLRADSLEEIVGLDVSYHGWTPAEAEDVTQTDLDAYDRKRRIRASRHSAHGLEDLDATDEGVDRFQS